MIKVLSCCLFCFFLIEGLIAQDLSFKSITTEEGLPSNEIYALITDRNGYIWGATDGGVFRFNGKEIKVFTINDGLPDNTVFKLLEDDRGRIWLSCFNGKIAYIEKDRVREIAGNEALGKLCKNSLIISMNFTKNGTLWIGSANHLYQIPPKDNYKEVKKLTVNSTGFYVREIERDRFIVFRNDSLSYLRAFPENYQITYSRIGSKDIRSSINNKLFKNGFYIIRHCQLKNRQLAFSLTNTFILQDKNGSYTSKQFDSYINFIYEDRNGIWVCTERNGVYLYENGNLSAEPKHYLKNYSVLYITSNHEGLWFGTYGKGVLFCPSVEVLQFSEHAFFGKNIVAFMPYKHSFFVMNENNMVYQISKNNHIECFSKPDNLILIEKGALMIDDDELLITSKCSEKINLTTRRKIDLRYKHGLPISATKSIKTGENDYIFLSFDLLIVVKDHKPIKEYLLPFRGRCLVKNDAGRIFIGTLNGLFEFKNNRFKEVIDSKKLLGCRINDIQTFGDYLLISTNGNGLLIYNVNSKKVIQITEKDGLASNFCTVSTYVNQEIWMGSKKGLSWIRFKNKNFELDHINNFDQSCGLISKEVNTVFFHENQLWLGTRKGLCLIRNPYEVLNSTPPKIFLEQVLVNNNLRDLNSSQLLELRYDENNLKFKVANFSFKNTSNRQFCYVLLNQDSKLKYTSYSQIEFQNLDPGDYTLKIYGLNNLGIKSVKPLLIDIRIASPFWFTWWFITLEILFILLFFALITTLIIKRFRHKELLKSSVEKRILEHQLLAIRAQMNPHFIFNAINSIQNFILISDVKSAHFYLGKFSKLIRSVLNHSASEYISIEEEINIMNNYIELEKMRLNDSMDFEISHSIAVDPKKHFIPNMLLQPLVENAIIHGLAPLKDRKGKLELHFYLKDDLLCIRVEDNGIGRKQAKINNQKKEFYHQSMGIKLVHEKVNIHAILNQTNSNIQVEDLYEGEKAMGTRVLISLDVMLENR